MFLLTHPITYSATNIHCNFISASSPYFFPNLPLHQGVVYINQLLCNSNCPTSAISELQEDNQTKPVTSSADMAALLARKFASYSQAPLSQPDLHSAILLPTSTERFSIQPFSAQSVFDSLLRLSTYRSTAGKLCNRFLKETAEATSQSLAVLFNRCLLT